MRVLIIGYACVPDAGGEISNTWSWAYHLSRFHDVWVLACPGEHPINRSFLFESRNAHLKFHWLGVPRVLAPWDHRHGKVGLALHYLQWLRLAYSRAIELHEQLAFDVVHHVCFGTVSAPPPFWKLPVPFVWGPVGGAQRVPSGFRQYISPLSGCEVLRSIRLALLPLSRSLRRTAQSSAVILATNPETHELLVKAGSRRVRLFLDSGIPSSLVSSPQIPRPRDMPFTLLWVGRMHPRKALPLALEALAETKDLGARLLVAGDGEMRGNWESCAKRFNLGGKVEFLGQVPWSEICRLYESADAFVFTSLRDSFGTQVLEAMAHGLPILTLDHQGVGTFVPPEAGIKVPLISPRQTVVDLARGIRRLALCPEERLKMGEAGRAFARTQTWEKRAERMSELYEEVLLGRTLIHLGKLRSYDSTRCKLFSPAKSAGCEAYKHGYIFPPVDSLRLRFKQFYRRATRKLEKTAVSRFGVSIDAALEKPILAKMAKQIAATRVVSENSSFEVLGVRVHAVQIQDVVAQMEQWIRERDRCHTIAPTSMHGIVEAKHDPTFKDILNAADLVVPDGMSLIWLGRRKGYRLPQRVYGPDLMLEFCEKTAGRGYRHFFYGGEPGVAERLAESLKRRFLSLEVCGAFSPPFQPLDAGEDRNIVEKISQAAPDVLWVGLGAPKQERWVHEHRNKLHVPVTVSVGAAFDWLSGRRRQAPRWMRDHGLEWLFRLLQEPRRLWRRYLLYGVQFIAYLALDSLRLKNFVAGRGKRESEPAGRPRANEDFTCIGIQGRT